MNLYASWFQEGTNNQGTLALTSSTDGITWNNFSNWVYGGTATIVRDPSLVNLAGTFYVAFTKNAAVSSFGLVSSTAPNSAFTDLPDVNCSTLAIGSATSCWSPEWFINPNDNSIHVIAAISTSGQAGFNFYEIHPSTATNLSGAWSNPVLLNLLLNGTVFDPTSNYMVDPFVLYASGAYHLFGVNFNFGGQPGFLHAINTSTSLTLGTWTVVDVNFSNVTAGWPNGLEGPAFYQRQGTWWAYMDHSLGQLNQHQIMYSTTTVPIPSSVTSTWTGWSVASNVITPGITGPGQGTPYINGWEITTVGTVTTTYVYPTGTDSTGYVFGISVLGPTASVPSGGLVTSPNNLTGFSGNPVARLGKG